MALDTAKAIAGLRELTKKFDNRLMATQPFYPQMCTVVESDGADEAYGMLGSMPGMREWEGDRLFHELAAADFVIKNRHWESSVAIKKTDIDDSRLKMYGPVLEQLAIEAAFHPDELSFEALIAGESEPCFDGQYFFDTDHSWGESGAHSNDLTFDASNHLAVTPTEFRDAFHQARAKMFTYKNDKGKFLNRPTLRKMSDLLCLVPPELEIAAHKGLTAELLSNDTNVVLDVPEIVTVPYMSSAVKFILINRGGVFRPLVFQARQPLKRKMKGDDDIEFKDVKFMTEARYNVGYFAWWTSVLTTFN
jgi:phage major head subunit gpT-like protein